MGSLAKRLGQLSRFSLESESANILKTTRANKIPGSLSHNLDGTFKRGHDMKAFGLGTFASMASRERYQRFTLAMHAVYSTMEQELDESKSDAVQLVWKPHGDILRRSVHLEKDLLDVMTTSELAQVQENPTPATLAYVDCIRQAGARNDGTLLGHLYCRYFADLFGGQVLATPYRVALNLPKNTPRHYNFDIDDRRTFIEQLYQDLNEAGESLTESQRDDVVKEAMSAFQHNINVYTEEPIAMDAAKGAVNICTGYAKSLISG